MTFESLKEKLTQHRIQFDELGGNFLRFYYNAGDGSYGTISLSESGEVVLNGRVTNNEDFTKWLLA